MTLESYQLLLMSNTFLNQLFFFSVFSNASRCTPSDYDIYLNFVLEFICRMNIFSKANKEKNIVLFNYFRGVYILLFVIDIFISNNDFHGFY
jgi:hypothetical protein